MLAIALALLSTTVSPAVPALQLSPGEAKLRGTSIVLVEGIGGFVASRHRIVSFGYDWNRGTFRAVEQRRGGSSGIARCGWGARDLEADRFRRLVERVLELGLPSLPLEKPAGVADIYGRKTSIRFSRAAQLWENQSEDGCEFGGSEVRVTPQQSAAFDAVIALLNGALAEGPLQPASMLERLPLRERSNMEVRMLARAVDVLRAMGRAGEVNANESTLASLGATGFDLRVPCRKALPYAIDSRSPEPPVGWWDVRFAPDGERVQEVRETPYEGESAADRARREVFVGAHPELLASQRDLVLAGWVDCGMSEAMIRAAWGDPVERTVEGRSVVLCYRRSDSSPQQFRMNVRLAEDGLSNCW